VKDYTTGSGIGEDDRCRFPEVISTHTTASTEEVKMPGTADAGSQNRRILLEIEDLSAQFHTDDGIVRAVNGVSYRLHEEECLGIVGESGCGKSVHARSIMGLIPRAYGSYRAKKIWFDGQDLLKLSGDQLRRIRGSRIGMVFQDPMSSLNPVMKIGDQLSEVLRIHRNMAPRQAWKRSEELLSLVRISDAAGRLHEYPFQFSGGMQQRVMIAMALACDPKLLIADEPTTALDVTIQAEIIKLVRDIQQEFKTAIMWITHDLGIVAGLADNVNVMYAGRIVERGGVLDIYERPLHPYTQGLLGSVPKPGDAGQRLSSIPGVPPNLIDLPPGCPFQPRCLYAKDVCRTENPELRMTDSDGHLAACFFWREIQEHGRANYAPSPRRPSVDHHEMRDAKKLLVLKGLKKYFPIQRGFTKRRVGDVKAVDGVSFDICAGETVGLVGESGSGKTTVGMSIARLTDPIEGSVVFMGKEIATVKSRELKRIRPSMQIIFQNPFSSLNPRQSVETIVSTPLRVHRVGNDQEIRSRTTELLRIVGLDPDCGNRYPHEFSGGQQQRIGIARALALNPELIICDEPISSLDVSIQAQIVNLLKDLQKEFGVSYLFISHDLRMTNYISDRIAVMYLGRIMELAEKEELYANPRHPYTRFLLSAIPVPDPSVEKKRRLLKAREYEMPSAANPPPGCGFNTRCPAAIEICFTSRPEFKETGERHYCACHLV
jgi:peptide/nickel transport system ATP-binding protein